MVRLLDGIIALFEQNGIRSCIIDGHAVNAYVEPLVSLDLDVALAVAQIGAVRNVLASHFQVEEFPHGLNVR